MLLSCGEQMSMSLMAMQLERLGCPARSFCGWQAGIHTEARHGDARILNVQPDRVKQALEKGLVAVVAGFQGIDGEGEITTIGRGGSDTTAVALAAWLKADKCQIFTDVDGVYNRDPRIYPDATRFGRISYEKMMALVENGAQVLHDRSVELARTHGIAVEVLSAFTGAPGTIVGSFESL
jgi:aspartate kinase